MAAGIFSLVPEDDMEDVLACLHAVTGLPVRMTDEAGEDLILLGAESIAFAIGNFKYLNR